MVTKSPIGLPGLELKHLFTLECNVGTPLIVGDGGMGTYIDIWMPSCYSKSIPKLNRNCRL